MERVLYPHYLAHPVGIGAYALASVMLCAIELSPTFQICMRVGPWTGVNRKLVSFFNEENVLLNIATIRLKEGMVITIEPGLFLFSSEPMNVWLTEWHFPFVAPQESTSRQIQHSQSTSMAWASASKSASSLLTALSRLATDSFCSPTEGRGPRWPG